MERQRTEGYIFNLWQDYIAFVTAVTTAFFGEEDKLREQERLFTGDRTISAWFTMRNSVCAAGGAGENLCPWWPRRRSVLAVSQNRRASRGKELHKENRQRFARFLFNIRNP